MGVICPVERLLNLWEQGKQMPHALVQSWLLAQFPVWPRVTLILLFLYLPQP